MFGLSPWSHPRTDPKSEVTQWLHFTGEVDTADPGGPGHIPDQQ